jgi:hypothetical protein
MPVGEVVLDRPQERVRKRTVDRYLISAPGRSTSGAGMCSSTFRNRSTSIHTSTPRNDHSLKVSTTELSDVERNAAAGLTPDDIDLDLTT